MRICSIILTTLVIFKVLDVYGQEAEPFPLLLKNKMQCFCYKEYVIGKKVKDSYNFYLNRDSIFSWKGLTYFKIESNIFFDNTYLRVAGNAVHLINTTQGWNLTVKDTPYFDYGQQKELIVGWKEDSTIFTNKRITLESKKYLETISDTIFQFATKTKNGISDGHHLSNYFISKNYGVIGLKFDRNDQPYWICFDDRWKSYFKSESKLQHGKE
jgi:hypothetical protein